MSGYVVEHLAAADAAVDDGAGVGVRVLDIDLACPTDGIGDGLAGDPSAFLVIRADIRDGEGHRAVDVVAIAEEGVHGDDLGALLERLLQRGDHLLVAHRGGDEVIQVALALEHIEDGVLSRRAPGIGVLGHLDVDAEVLASLEDALLHDLVERVQDAGQEGDVGLLVVLCGSRRRQHGRGQQRAGT